MKNEIVLFTDGDINIEVELSPELETVWLTQKQMGELFEVKQATLSEHINNIISSKNILILYHFTTRFITSITATTLKHLK